MLKTEPVITISGIAAAIVTICAVFHVVLDTSAVETVLAVLVPLIAAGIARAHVTPAKSR
jgi:hypothetical protein